MSYIKLRVRSGGIYIKQKKDFQPLCLNLIQHPENKNKQVLPLIRESSVKGLFSWLIGETVKIEQIENNEKSSVKKLNITLDVMVQSSAYKIVSEPHVTVFFERKKSAPYDPNVDLKQHTFKTADSTVKLLENPLKRLFQTESIEKINKKFQESRIKKDDSDYNTLKPPECESIPETNLGKKMKKYFQKFHEEKKPIHKETLNLIDKTNTICLKDPQFKEKFQNFTKSQFSVFENPSFTKPWIDKKYWKIVRGGPANIACIDFDIYLSETVFMENQNSDCFSWNDIVNKMKNGSNIARWGEGGVVFVDYHLDTMGCPYDTKDPVFLEISALRKAGMKIKKYNWEQEIEKEKTT